MVARKMQDFKTSDYSIAKHTLVAIRYTKWFSHFVNLVRYLERWFNLNLRWEKVSPDCDDVIYT